MQYLIVAILIITGLILSITLGKLTKPAACIGGVIAGCLYIAFGPAGLVMLAVFFVSASIATRAGREIKSKIEAIVSDSGPRTTGQVLANGGTAGGLAIAGMILPEYVDVFRIMAAASLASATSDTLSSELGSIYGRNFYNILSFKKAQRGDNGVVSGEGFIFGLLGSGLIAAVYGIAFGLYMEVILIFIAGFIGNISDSIAGALYENKGRLTNNQVNTLNTIVAAAVALIGVWLVSILFSQVNSLLVLTSPVIPHTY